MWTEGSEKNFLLYNLTAKSKFPNLINLIFQGILMLLMYTGEHANIFKVVEENHLTKKQGCVYTFVNVIFPHNCLLCYCTCRRTRRKQRSGSKFSEEDVFEVFIS